MDDEPTPSRAEALRRQGQIDIGFAVAIAATLLFGMVTAGTAVIVGGVAIWLAVRGLQMLEQSVPLADGERQELERLRFHSRPVRQMLEALEKHGDEPLRYDLGRCRQVAMLESLVRRSRT
jgi:hypothetical protein